MQVAPDSTSALVRRSPAAGGGDVERTRTPRTRLDDPLVPGPRKRAGAGRRQSNPVLVRLDLGDDPDPHGARSVAPGLLAPADNHLVRRLPPFHLKLTSRDAALAGRSAAGSASFFREPTTRAGCSYPPRRPCPPPRNQDQRPRGGGAGGRPASAASTGRAFRVYGPPLSRMTPSGLWAGLAWHRPWVPQICACRHVDG